jgi:hypothetical protein
LIAEDDEKWIPPLDYVWIKTDIYTDSSIKQYFTSLYHSVLLLGGNDIGPRGNLQLVFTVVILITGAIINASIFGNIAVILQTLNRKQTEFQDKLDNANSAMKNLGIPQRTTKIIQNYLTYTQNTLDHQIQLDSFLSILSPSMKTLVTKHIFEGAVNKNHIFSNHLEILDIILYDLKTLLFLPEDEIIRQREEPDKICFISKGDCHIYVIDEMGVKREVTLLGVGKYFGEIALMK